MNGLQINGVGPNNGSKIENGYLHHKNINPTIIDKLNNLIEKNKKYLSFEIKTTLNILVVIHFAFATNYYVTEVKDCDEKFCLMGWCHGYGMLTLLYGLIYISVMYFQYIQPMFGKQIRRFAINPVVAFLRKLFSTLTPKLIAILIILAGLATFLYFETKDSPERLRSLAGICVLLLIGLACSKHPTKVNWRPVLLGLAIQFLLGLFCIRWEVGRDIFACVGDKVATFLHFGKDGAEFVFGKLLVDELAVFAFSVLSVIYFFSFCISILYYMGAMQWLILKLGWVLQTVLGTTVCESVIAVANIFLGMSESALLIRPLLKDLTDSEMHSIMASGFATVSGSVFAAYISFGAEPAHLVTASVMAAPAALSFAKLIYPETKVSKTTSENIVIENSTDTSILDAATNGANAGIQLVLGIIANTIAFVSAVAFLNSITSWLAVLVGFHQVTLEWIFGKIFVPLSYLLGVPWDECDKIGGLIGTKTILSEFVAYKNLGELKLNGLSNRSAAIATYALCGFANPSSLGIMIGNLGAMVPEKRHTIVSVAIRAFVCGCCVCFMTASIAGLLMTEDIFNSVGSVNST